MRKNIVHITVDSLRADVCGFTDSDGCAPYLSSLTDDAVVFKNAHSPGPRTASSIPAIFTGEFSRQEEYSLTGQRRAIETHVSTHETIPQRLRELGYTTVGFTANPWTTKDTGFDQGFDEFYELNPNSDNDISTIVDTPLVNAMSAVFDNIKPLDRFRWDTRREWFAHWTAYYNHILRRLDDIKEPYYVWIFTMDTHHPYILPSEFRRETNGFKMYWSLLKYMQGRDSTIPEYAINWLREVYRDATRSADEFVRRVYQERRGEDTVLVFHSDHGESHGEHGTYGHELRLYDENTHVPLLLDGICGADEVEELFSLVHLPEIIERVATDGTVPCSEWTEEFVVTQAEGQTPADRRSEMRNYVPHYCAIQNGRWKYIVTRSGAELYDRSTDPREELNVASERAELTGLMDELLSMRTRRQNEKWKIVDSVRRAEI